MSKHRFVLATLSLSFFAVGSTASSACGGRSFEVAPLGGGANAGGGVGDDDGDGGRGGGTGGAGARGGGGGVGASGGAGASGGVGNAGGGSTGGSGGGNPVDCLTCAAFECPAILECFADPACAEGTICAVTDCLSGGAPDPICFLDCFGGDPQAAFAAFDAISCVFTTCGADCADLIGGGLPGF